MSLDLAAAGSPPPGPLRRPYWILAAVCLLAMMSTIGAAMPYPILAPIFVGGGADGFTRWAGLPPTVLMGVALAVNPLGILVGSLFSGPLSDRYGRRAIFTVTLSAAFLGHLATAAALAARQYPLFVLARFATGLAESNTAVARAVVGDMHAQIDRTRGFAWLNACLYSGWLLGPLVGGLTLPFGEPVPFLLAAAMMLPCLAILGRVLPPAPARTGPVDLRAALREKNVVALLRADRTFGWLFALQLAYTLALTTIYEFAPLWMQVYAGLDSRGIALVTAAQCGVMTATSALAGRFGASRTGAHPLRRAARLALAAVLGLALLAVLPGRAGLAVIVGLGLPLALYNAVLPAWMSERFAAHGQGRVMGLLSTIFCIANVIVAVAGGWLAVLSTRWVMGLGGAWGVCASLLMLRLARREQARDAGAREAAGASS
jgi:MFS family permease